jgi:hypothetical protein
MLIDKSIGGVWRQLIEGFRTLQRIQYDAPWKSGYRSKC